MSLLDELTASSSTEEVAAATIAEAKRRGYSKADTIAIVGDGLQESNFRLVWDPTHRWFGDYQQDSSYPNRFTHAGNIRGFFDRLDVQCAKPGASDDMWLNICWLQQRPNWPSAQYWWDHGRRAYLTEIKRREADAITLVNKYWGDAPQGGTPMPALTQGDPTWLLDALKSDGQINVKTLGGWDGAGHGDFREVRGIMFHHTGNARESADSIRRGRPDLGGPLANLHIAPDGTVTVVAVGVCWHAGTGSLPWLPPNMGNWYLIGVECAWPFDTSLGPATAFKEPWPKAQILAMRNVAAAVCRRGNFGVDRVTTHKEYAGRAQGKWDPGNLDPVWFRSEVAKDLSGFQFPGEGVTPTTTPAPIPSPVPAPDQFANVLIHRGMVGLAVSKLQLALNRNGTRLVVDGDFGPATEAAVRAYQAIHRGLAVDGVVGPMTAQSLGLTL